MTQKAILILGGSGFIASQLLRKLPPPVYVISRHRLDSMPPGVEVFQGGLDDDEILAEILPKCKWIVHLASSTTPGTSLGNAVLEGMNNILPNVRLIQLLQDYPQVNVMYVSSGGAVYGNASSEFICEDSPLHPLSYYAAGKVSIEAFFMALVEQSPRVCIILRPANIYGPGQIYRKGFGIIPTILKFQEENECLDIWGDGENVRDYIYIDDFVELCTLMLSDKELQSGTHVYNVGSSKGTSLNELCNLVEVITSKSVVREYHPARSIDVKYIVLDTSKVRERFDWRPKTTLEDGLRKTWDWWSNK